MKGLNFLTEGAEIVYADPRKFDVFGVGTVQKVTTRKDIPVPMMVEIIFPDALTAQRHFLPVDVFMEGIRKKEIEVTTDENVVLYQWRIQERELINKPVVEAVKEISLFSGPELSTLLELLKERVEDKLRLWKEEAVLLMGEISQFIAEEEEVRELFAFLLEQTKRKAAKKRRAGAQPYSSYSLSLAGRLRREEYEILAKCLSVAAGIALKKGDEKMNLAVRRTAERFQAHSSQILKRTAKAVLAGLGR